MGFLLALLLLLVLTPSLHAQGPAPAEPMTMGPFVDPLVRADAPYALMRTGSAPTALLQDPVNMRERRGRFVRVGFIAGVVATAVWIYASTPGDEGALKAATILPAVVFPMLLGGIAGGGIGYAVSFVV